MNQPSHGTPSPSLTRWRAFTRLVSWAVTCFVAVRALLAFQPATPHPSWGSGTESWQSWATSQAPLDVVLTSTRAVALILLAVAMIGTCGLALVMVWASRSGRDISRLRRLPPVLGIVVAVLATLTSPAAASADGGAQPGVAVSERPLAELVEESTSTSYSNEASTSAPRATSSSGSANSRGGNEGRTEATARQRASARAPRSDSGTGARSGGATTTTESSTAQQSTAPQRRSTPRGSTDRPSNPRSANRPSAIQRRITQPSPTQPRAAQPSTTQPSGLPASRALSDSTPSAEANSDGESAGAIRLGQPVPNPSTPGSATYTVRSGDNLWSIAHDIEAARLNRNPSTTETTETWFQLIEANRSRLVNPKDPGLIYPGQILVLPG